jgi:hypothetical protein
MLILELDGCTARPFVGSIKAFRCDCGHQWATVKDLGYPLLEIRKDFLEPWETMYPMSPAFQEIVSRSWEAVLVRRHRGIKVVGYRIHRGAHVASVNVLHPSWGQYALPTCPKPMPDKKTPPPLNSLRSYETYDIWLWLGGGWTEGDEWVILGDFRLVPAEGALFCGLVHRVHAFGIATLCWPARHVAFVVGTPREFGGFISRRCWQCWVRLLREQGDSFFEEKELVLWAHCREPRIPSPYVDEVRALSELTTKNDVYIEVTNGKAWVRLPWVTVWLDDDTRVRVGELGFESWEIRRQSKERPWLNIYVKPVHREW